jgi:hypothetical protein
MRIVTPTTPRAEWAARHFEALLSSHDRLCDDLEALADSLPDHIDTSAAMALAHDLHPVLRSCHDHEETFVFPALLGCVPEFQPTLLRLRAEHFEDEDQAIVVADAVTAYVRNRGRADADPLGYLMRGLFQPVRRHAAFDRHVTLPLYRRTIAS